MNNQEKLSLIRAQEQDDGISPPPRLVMWLAAGFFGLVVVGAIATMIFLQNKPSMISLFDTGVKAAPLLTLAVLAAGVAFRKRLPRRFLLWVVAGLAVIWVIGSVAFVVIYRNNFLPGQRDAAKNYLPFMERFDPPLPAPDTALPTPVSDMNSGISPEDLLGAPLGVGTLVSTRMPSAAVELQPSATFTPAPTLTPTLLPTMKAEATEAAAPISQPDTLAASSAPTHPIAARLYGFTAIKQTWNNCGPANTTMALSYYGWQEGQEVAQSFLRPDREDKNVNPSEIVAFINDETGVRALTRIGGDMELLKNFLANDLPVLIETGYLYEGSDWIGHYQTVVGYDDAQQIFYVYDSYLGSGENGAGIPKPYAEFDQYWQHFNRTFIVLYRQEEEDAVRAILGERADLTLAAEKAREVAQAEAQANSQNGYAWFNLGTSLARLGLYAEAASAYDQSRRIGVPWRITFYQFGPFEAYYNVGRYDEVLALVNVNLNNSGEYIEETHYWKGRVLAAQGKAQEAAEAFRRALQHNPRFAAAQDALNALPV